mgnify:CR=1 FL=1
MASVVASISVCTGRSRTGPRGPTSMGSALEVETWPSDFVRRSTGWPWSRPRSRVLAGFFMLIICTDGRGAMEPVMERWDLCRFNDCRGHAMKTSDVKRGARTHLVWFAYHALVQFLQLTSRAHWMSMCVFGTTSTTDLLAHHPQTYECCGDKYKETKNGTL